MEGERAQLAEHVLGLMQEVYRALRPIVPKEWLGLDLTMPQLKILLLLFADGPTRMGALASGLGVSLATTTGITDRLVQRGLILRESQTEDRRVVLCKLSEKGQELVSRMWELGQVQARSLLETMTSPKLQIIAEAMEAIIQAASTAEQEHRH